MPDELVRALISFFAIIDPVGNLLVFHLLTAPLAFRGRAAVALASTSFAFLVLLLFAVTGERVLDYLGISLESFRIAAGLLLMLPALRLAETGQPIPLSQASEAEAMNRPYQLAFVPLALPLLAGPGALATAVSFADLVGLGYTLTAMGLVLALTAALFAASALALQVLGASVLRVLARLVGVMLMAIAVNLIVEGLAHFFG